MEDRRKRLEQATKLLNSTGDVILNRLEIVLPTVKEETYYFATIDSEGRLDPLFYHPRYIKTIRVMLNGKYPTVSLSELSEPIVSGATPKAKGEAYTSRKEGVPFIRSGDLTNENVISYEDVLYIKREVHATMLKRSQLRKGDILLAIVGATIGKVSVYMDQGEANINQAIARIRLKDEIANNPFYVTFFLREKIGQIQLNRLKRPVARANINCEEVGMVRIPIPPRHIQNEIVETISNALARSTELKKGAEEILQKAKTKIEELIVQD